MSHSHCRHCHKERESEREKRWGAKEISTCTKCCFICVRTTTLLPPSALLLSLRRQTVRAHKHPYSQLRFARGTHAILQTYVGEAETRSVSVTKGSYFRSRNSVKIRNIRYNVSLALSFSESMQMSQLIRQ